MLLLHRPFPILRDEGVVDNKPTDNEWYEMDQLVPMAMSGNKGNSLNNLNHPNHLVRRLKK
jgi:hypothetical protein